MTSVLNTYFNTGCFSARDRFLSVFCPTLPFSFNRDKVVRAAGTISTPDIDRSQEVAVPSYTGSDPHAKRMKEFLAPSLKNDLFAVILHGSLATDEVIPYSDFDALVVIKDDVIKSWARMRRLAVRLFKAQSIMYDLDPLQHHGWFVLLESQLRDHPADFFPPEIFPYSRVLLPDNELTLQVEISKQVDFGSGFRRVSERLVREVESGRLPGNLFQLKAFLSRLMLLPSLYLQARDGRGVFKAVSFERAAVDFDKESWQVIEKASRIRQEWTVEFSGVKRWIMTRQHILSRFFVKHFAAGIPDSVKEQMGEHFFLETKHLCVAMQEKLREKASL